MGTTMECKLCQKKKSLRKSHIIPEFFYRPGYDEKGRLFVVRQGISEDRYIQKGIREYLLCSECEHFLNDNYEKYFHEFWYEKKNMPKEAVSNIYKVRGLDYAKAKLFLLPDSNSICGEFIMSPIVCRYDARHLYVFTFGGCIWNFVVSSHPIGYPVDVCSLSNKGTITMPTISLTDFPPVKKFISAQVGRFGVAGSK